MRYFLCYSRSDSAFVLQLAQDLRAAGVSIWLDQLDIPAGALWDREVENALHECGGLLVVVSPVSVSSRNVLDEVSYAFDEGMSVVPVLTAESEIPFRLRRLQHIDFTGDYDSAMKLLVATLSESLSQTGVMGILEAQHLFGRQHEGGSPREDTEKEGPQDQAGEQTPRPAAEEPADPPGSPAPPAARSRGGSTLRRAFLAAAVALSVVAVLALAWFRAQRQSDGGGDSGRQRLAVLPFADLTGDPARGYLSDLVTEEVTMHLSRVAPDRLTVIGRSSAARYRSRPLPEIGADLDVQWVVDGSVAMIGEQTRVTASLIQVSDESSIWSNAFAGAPSDLIELGQRVADALSIELTPQQNAAVEETLPRSTDAHRAYLLGRAALQERTASGLEEAVARFEEAVGYDPAYALAHSGLADAHALLARYGVRPATKAMPRAIRAAERALELNDRLAEAHASLAYAVMHYEWDWPRAGDAFRRSIELNPNYVTAHQWYARYLSSQGRFDEAITQAKAAADLDPRAPIVLSAVGYAYYFAGEYGQAIEWCERAIAVDGDFPRAFWNLGLAYAGQGRHDRAIETLERARSLSSGSSMVLSTLGYVYARAGRDGQTREILQALLERAEQGSYVQSFDLAVLHVGLGEKTAALDLLDVARRERSARLVEAGSSPLLAELRGEPRFQALLGRLRLVEEAPIPLTDFEDPGSLVFDAELSTGILETTVNPAPAGVNPSPQVGRYTRDAGELFDVLIYRTGAIDDAGPFLTGRQRLFLDVYTGAPEGTEILLQLESADTTAANYPTGRHSRFQAYTTTRNQWQRLELVLLDRPDRDVAADAIDHLVLLFAPNTKTGDVFHYDNLVVRGEAR